jgi:hypothetical protein
MSHRPPCTCEDAQDPNRRPALVGTSGRSPEGMRSWKCRIPVASLRGIEIASASPSAVLNSTAYAQRTDCLGDERKAPGPSGRCG